MPDDFKDRIPKKSNGESYYTGQKEEKISNYSILLAILKNIALCVYGEYAKQRKNYQN
jgi:hypothetical protein